MQPIGYPAPRSAAALALALVAAYDAHELCRVMVGASRRSSFCAPARSRTVTCNLAQFAMLHKPNPDPAPGVVVEEADSRFLKGRLDAHQGRDGALHPGGDCRRR